MVPVHIKVPNPLNTFFSHHAINTINPFINILFLSRRILKTNVEQRLGQTLTYNPETEYRYDESRSCAGCDPIKDKITTVNYPLLVSEIC
jgi:hypothetical protein